MKKFISKYCLFLVVVGVVAATVNFAAAQKSFSDLSPSHSNYTAIMELQKRSIISGYPDGSFQPERTVNRVEALKMVILTAKKAQKLAGAAPKTGKIAFEDIDRGAWYMPTLEQAVSYDIVSGYPDGFFRPERTVNLVESLKMALKAFEVDLSKTTVLENPYADAFKDQWYAKYAEYSKRNSLIDADSKNMIYPDQGMKRGTLAEVLYRLFSAQTLSPVSADSTPLKILAEKRGIRFGAYYNSDRRSIRHDEIFEKEMKFMTIYLGWASTPGSNNDGVTPDDIALYDELVSWGQARDMEISAQSLVWFDNLELPEWFKATSTADIEGIMNRRIDTLMGRYKGKIKYWNVVNEAFDDSGKLRQGHKWVAAMGDDYIRKAFVRAHAADPSAILYYNDYDIQLETNRAKFDGVKNLLIDLKKQGIPVHALGWQMHVTPKDFHAPTFLTRLNEIADLGFDNYVTELDVAIPENATAADLEQQKQTYKGVVETFLKARRPPLSPTVGPYKTLITWGIHDGDPDWFPKNHPFLFDENFNKKPAYFGVQEALK